jgi:uncharacterized membrane protein (UPF0127 family)
MRALVIVGLLVTNCDAVGQECHPQAESLLNLPQADIEVVTAAATHRFQVWVAADDASRERGLMHVPRLAADHGMLFLWQRPHIASFWMKDTCIPLDLLFVAMDGRIMNIARDAEPFSLTPIPSNGPVAGVLELAGGSAHRLGIAPGDRVRHPAFAAGH